MPLNRRQLLAAPLLLPLSAAAAPVPSADYRDDSRTARSVAFVSPRAPLHECLKVISDAVGVKLAADPRLASEPLTGYVPARPLRESMDALAELFDGVWKAVPGVAGEPTGLTYRLEPDAARWKAQEQERKALLQRYVQAIDTQAVASARQLGTRANAKLPSSEVEVALSVWSALKPMEKERALSGEVVPVLLPEPAAFRVALLLTSADAPPPKGSQVAATLELDDRSDTASPSLRVVVACLTGTGIKTGTARLEYVSLLTLPKPPAPPPPMEDEPSLPAKVGENGALSGGRDEVVVRLGEVARLPILSRHRAMGGNYGMMVGERPPSQVIHQIAGACFATAQVNSRGYWLLRSQTEALDPSEQPQVTAGQAFRANRPAKGATGFQALAELGGLAAFRLSVLERSNLCSNEAHYAREYPALLRFYRSLTMEQRAALFSNAGLDASVLQPLQVVTLAEESYRRGDWDLSGAFGNWKGVTLRFREVRDGTDARVELEALRGDAILSRATIALPAPEPEEVPQARR